MKQVILNIFASAFFGTMAAGVLVHVELGDTLEAALTGFIGYMGVLTIELLGLYLTRYYSKKP